MLNQPPHISKLIMPATNPNTSRLRKSGLTRNVAAVVVAITLALHRRRAQPAGGTGPTP